MIFIFGWALFSIERSAQHTSGSRTIAEDAPHVVHPSRQLQRLSSTVDIAPRRRSQVAIKIVELLDRQRKTLDFPRVRQDFSSNRQNQLTTGHLRKAGSKDVQQIAETAFRWSARSIRFAINEDEIQRLSQRKLSAVCI